MKYVEYLKMSKSELADHETFNDNQLKLIDKEIDVLKISSN